MTDALQQVNGQKSFAPPGEMMLSLTRQVLDKMPLAIFVVGRNCKPHYANGCGERMLVEGKLLSSRAGAVVPAMGGSTQRKFSQAVANAADGGRDSRASVNSILLAAECGARAVACISAMPGREFCGIFIARPQEQAPWTEDVLSTAFGLTPAEARVATLLAAGSSPADIAEAQGLSVHTVRTQLARAYMKTECASQPALIAKINALVPPLAGAEG